jgi:hypothetical protein
MENCNGDLTPYEIFAGCSSKIKIPKKYASGKIIKEEKKSIKSVYDLVIGEGEDAFIFSDIV